MKYADTRPCADPEKAARRLLEIANTVEPRSYAGTMKWSIPEQEYPSCVTDLASQQFFRCLQLR